MRTHGQMGQDLPLVKNLNSSGKKPFKSPKPDATRLLVFDVLTEVNRNGGYSNLLLPAALTASGLDERDKGFATELLYGTIRMQGRHDWILSQLSDRPWSEVDSGIVDVARMGAHQLFEMRVPTHAAVSATVELARKVLGESKASFVNALLRKASSQSIDQWLEPLSGIKDPIERLAIEYSHPEWIVSAYFDLLKDFEEVEKALAANNVPALPTLVSWPGKSTQSDLVELGASATEISPFGARLAGSPGSLEIIRHRNAGVQDEGSQLVAWIFSQAAKEVDNWLDLCAGPGGKAALLANIASTSNKKFTANEVSETRAKLVKNVVGSFPVLVTDGRLIGDQGERYGAILADVPCTGIGALRRRPEVRWRRTTADLRALIQLQRELIDAALEVVEVGGVFGYATCSPHLAETRIQVKDLLRSHPNYEQIDIRQVVSEQTREKLGDSIVDGSMALWTHKQGTDAMFLALFRRIS